MSLRFQPFGERGSRIAFRIQCCVIILASFVTAHFQLPAAGTSGNVDCGKLSSLEGNVWRIDEEVLKLVERDFQFIVDCAPVGGSLLLGVDSLELDKTLVLTRAITVTSRNGDKVRVPCPGNETAIHIESVGVSLSHLSFEGCYLNGSSIIMVGSGSNATISSALFVENVNEAVGGCISASNASLAIHTSSFFGNNGLEGGAVYIRENSTLSIIGAYFYQNSAVNGSAVCAHDSHVNVLDTTFMKNHAVKRGGAIHTKATEGGMGVTAVKNSKFIGNEITGQYEGSPRKVAGGAIYTEGSGSSFGIMHSLFEDNRAVGYGGAVFCFECRNLVIEHSRFLRNSALKGAGVMLESSRERSINTTVRLFDTVFEDNRAENLDEFERRSYGGAVAAVFVASFEMVQCSVRNNTSGFVGGGVHLAAVRSALIGNSSFIKNSAPDAGGIFVATIKMEGRKNLTVVDSIFKENSAKKKSGGAFEIVGAVDTLLQNVVFEKNVASVGGGGIYVFNNAHVNISFCYFTDNRAGMSGGAVHFEHADVTRWHFQEKKILTAYVENSTFAKNTAGEVIPWDGDTRLRSLTGRGGGIAIVGAGTNITLTGSSIEECTASVGGGLLWDGGTVLSVIDVGIRGNYAALGGGLHAEFGDRVTSSFVLREVNFFSNDAQHGGGLSLSATAYPFEDLASLDFDGLKRIANASVVNFWNNKASSRGGGVVVEEVLFDCMICQFSSNHALGEGRTGMGGAISLHHSGAVDLKQSTVQGNEADQGGGIYVENGVVNCTSVDLINNLARDVGGAVALVYGASVTSRDGVLMNCTTCNIVGNNASKIGGGVHLITEAPVLNGLEHCDDLNNTEKVAHMPQQDIIELADKCKSLANYPYLLEHRKVVLLNTVSGGNNAEAGGDAIFATDLGMVMCCKPECRPLSSEDAWRACQDDDETGTEGKTEKQKRHGTLISSIASKVVLKPPNVEDHKSGTPLPTIDVKLLDALGQLVSGQKMDLVVGAKDPDIISGNPVAGVLLQEGASPIDGIILTAPPGNYVLTFNVSGELYGQKTIQAELNVTVRNCEIGEVCAGINCTRCNPCAKDLYSFNTSVNCTGCPPNAECHGSTLVPRNGFWHRSSWSKTVRKCLYAKACTFNGRLRKLRNNASLSHKEDRLPLTWKDINYRQCRKGYTGPLCGSCASNYGRITGFKCRECPVKEVSVSVVLMSFLVLCAVSGYLTRDAVRQAKVIGSKRYGKHNYAVQESGNFGEAPDQAREALLAEYHSSYFDDSEQHSEIEPIEEAEPSGEAVAKHDVEWMEGGKENVGRSQTKPRLETKRSTEVFKILINFLQVVGTAAAINANWTDTVVKLFVSADFFSGVSSGSGLQSFDCAFEPSILPRSVQSSLVQVLFPFGVWIVFAAFWAIRNRFKKWDRKQLSRRFVVGLLVVLYVSYINITKKAVRMFNCIDVNISTDPSVTHSSRIWAADTMVGCYKGPHAYLSGFGFLLLVCVVLGYPVLLILKLLSSKAKLDDPEFAGTYGFLYKAYAEGELYWEALVMLRKGLLATIVVFSEPLGPDQQGTLASIVLFFAFALHKYFSPYDASLRKLNALESWSLAISLLVFYCGGLFAQNKSRTEVGLILTVVLMCAVVGFVAFALYELGVSGLEDFGEWLKERNLPKKGSLWSDTKTAASYLWAETKTRISGSLKRHRPRLG